MRAILKLTTAMAITALMTSGCAVTKVVTVPAKAVYNTGKFATKGAIGGAKIAGKGVYYTGKGAYKTGETAVKVTNGALNTTANLLTITTQVVDLSGKVITLSKTISPAELDAHIAAAKAAKEVVSVFVDVAR